MGRALLVLDSPADRQKAVTWIGKAPVGTRVEFKASKRTLPQNDLLWALLTEFAQQYSHNGIKYEPSQWKAIFLHAFGREVSFLPSLDGKTFLPIELSSSDLSKQEMTDFIEFIIKEAAERGVILHNPKDTDSGSSPEPDADEQSPAQSAEADETPNSSASSPSQDDQLFPADRADLIVCAEEMLSLAGLKYSSDQERDDALSQSKVQWEGQLKDLHPKIGSIYVSAKAVAVGKRTVAQARSFLAETLECSVEELGG